MEAIYNDCYVNYYLNLEQNTKTKGVPDNLRKKLDQIDGNGGRDKIELEIKIIKKNSEQVRKFFSDIKKSLSSEEEFDNQKRSKYGQKWNRPPSNVAQNSYRTQISSSYFVMQPMKPKLLKPTKPTKRYLQNMNPWENTFKYAEEVKHKSWLFCPKFK